MWHGKSTVKSYFLKKRFDSTIFCFTQKMQTVYFSIIENVEKKNHHYRKKIIHFDNICIFSQKKKT